MWLERFGHDVRFALHTLGRLVIGEFAPSLVLLSSAGLLVRSFWNLLNAPLGFDQTNVTVLHTRLPYPNDSTEDLYPTAAARGAVPTEPLTTPSVPHLYASLYQREGTHLTIFVRGHVETAAIERECAIRCSSRAIAGLLVGVSPDDPLTFVAATLVLSKAQTAKPNQETKRP